MNVSDFDFELPESLIAQYPTQNRSDSRLLLVSPDGSLIDSSMEAIIEQLYPNDCLIINNTKVVPARLYGHKDTGGKVEILLERVLDQDCFLAQIKASRAPKVGQTLSVDVDTDVVLTVSARQDSFFEITTFGIDDLLTWFVRHGHMPLPPYIQRGDEQQDTSRYQTVYGSELGAVAAPTAGLHYTKELLNKISAKGVDVQTITLHIGAGTYQPVRVSSIEDHQMHSEWCEVSQAVCDAISRCRQQGGRVVAVGTTVIRSLETAAQQSFGGGIEPYIGDTELFIYPGFQFNVVDVLQTNFHLPESTLLMLVSAFAGRDTIKKAYQHAINNQYRFFSYGDAMLLHRAKP